MAIQYVGGGTSIRAGSTFVGCVTPLTTLTGGISATAEVGDLVIATFATASNVERSIGMATPGYTEIVSQFVDSPSPPTTVDTNFRVYYKFLTDPIDASSQTTPTGNAADGMSMHIGVFRGVDHDNPFDVDPQFTTHTTSIRPTPSPITPITTGAFIYIGATASSQGLRYLVEEPSITSCEIRYVNDTYDSSILGGYHEWTSGEYVPVQLENSSGGDNTQYTSATVTIALRPAGGGPAPEDTDSEFSIWL